MKTFIILAHPESRSFNGALFRTSLETLQEAGHPVQSSDLYAMKFDPVSDRRNFTSVKDGGQLKLQVEEMHAAETGGFAPDVETEIRKVEWCDLMIWHFPLWWFGAPAILKGWVDRVFAMGRTYGQGRIYETGVFRGKRAVLSLTTGGPESSYRRGGFNGDINGILRPLQRGILRFTGFDVLVPHVVYGPARMDDEARARVLGDWAERLRRIETESPIEIGDY